MCFPFTTSSLAYLLNFSINLIDHKNQQISFENNKKNKHIKFYNRCFSKMNRKLRPTKSPYKLKDEQVNFLLENMEKIWRYKKVSRNKGKQIAEVKKILQGAKNS